MKKKKLLSFLVLLCALSAHADEWIRINQLGYLPQSIKVAVFMSEEGTDIQSFQIFNAQTDKLERTIPAVRQTGEWGNMKSTCRLDFSDFEQPGTYYLKAGNAVSPHFPINAQVYDGTADFLLKYMRQQRCGYNPFLKDSCHVHDGYIVYHPTKTGQHLDVRGGWHDATDYLQYTTTSANAIYQMMFAYQQNPEAFGDEYDAAGHAEANGIPDIIDEIKWGMDWLNRMNPEPGELYNQIADDRDHAGMRLPQDCKVDYGYGPGLGRPVYFCSGEPQVRGTFMNATTGVASTAGKFASCFALGSRILKPFYPEFAAFIGSKADAAYQEGIKKPGVCQTASVAAPYIYEEDNWVDDMELGAMELYHSTGDKKYLDQAIEYGRREPVTPWMGADSARHYQWYPFMNMGHYHIAKVGGNKRLNQEFLRNMHAGIQRTYEKAIQSPFMHGIPYIWCSNNLTTAMLTQCRLYRETTNDQTYAEMEASMRDWLFGCNPWGTSMIVELPMTGDYPIMPHSSLLNAGVGTTTGGLIDGPVYATIFENLKDENMTGIPNTPGQDYERFQGEMVYHDAIGDYSTNEPTMDGTACLTYYLSSMQMEGMRQAKLHDLPADYWRTGFPQLVEQCKDVLKAAYMAENKISTHYDIPNWEGYPVELWEYHTGVDIKKNVKKRGLVYMLNPSAEKLATWIATACWEVKQSVDTLYTNQLVRFIKWQSGAQFPVAGVVYEDMYTKGFFEPYIFKDGVTVYVANPDMMPADKHCTDEQLEYYLHLTNDDLKPNTGRYARICSTFRTQYYKNGGTEDVGDNDENRKHHWLTVVRKLYQQAWNSDRNELIIAWARDKFNP